MDRHGLADDLPAHPNALRRVNRFTDALTYIPYMLSIYEKLNELLFSNIPFVMVTLVDVVGSSPQNGGSKMLVTQDGLYGGTIGGGKVEFKAINEAKSLLENKSPDRLPL